MNPYRFMLSDMYGGGLLGGQQQVGPAPRGVPEGRLGQVSWPGILGGLLGGPPKAQRQQYQSFNPNGSPSAAMFDQYMNMAMGPAPFRFNSYQFPALPQQQPQQSPQSFYGNGATPWQMQFGGGGTVGGGN